MVICSMIFSVGGSFSGFEMAKLLHLCQFLDQMRELRISFVACFESLVRPGGRGFRDTGFWCWGSLEDR